MQDVQDTVTCADVTQFTGLQSVTRTVTDRHVKVNKSQWEEAGHHCGALRLRLHWARSGHHWWRRLHAGHRDRRGDRDRPWAPRGRLAPGQATGPPSGGVSFART